MKKFSWEVKTQQAITGTRAATYKVIAANYFITSDYLSGEDLVSEPEDETQEAP